MGQFFQRVGDIFFTVDLFCQVEGLAIGLSCAGQIAGILVNIPGGIDPCEYGADISELCGALIRFEKQLQRPFVISLLVIRPAKIA